MFSKLAVHTDIERKSNLWYIDIIDICLSFVISSEAVVCTDVHALTLCRLRWQCTLAYSIGGKIVHFESINSKSNWTCTLHNAHCTCHNTQYNTVYRYFPVILTGRAKLLTLLQKPCMHGVPSDRMSAGSTGKHVSLMFMRQQLFRIKENFPWFWLN